MIRGFFEVMGIIFTGLLVYESVKGKVEKEN